jgi:hypothetical protein
MGQIDEERCNPEFYTVFLMFKDEQQLKDLSVTSE